MIKISDTVYLKDFEKKQLEEITVKINEIREKDGKKIQKPSVILHEIIRIGMIDIKKTYAIS